MVETSVIEQISRKLLNINFDTFRMPEELQMMVIGKRIPTDEEKILGVLDKIKLLVGYSLELEFPDDSGCGGRTYINIKKPNGNLSKKFLDFVIVDDSPLGALQIYFLSKLWHHLPMFWHGYYDQRFSVFSKDDLLKIKRKGFAYKLFKAIPENLLNEASSFILSNVKKGAKSVSVQKLLLDILSSYALNIAYKVINPNDEVSLFADDSRYKLFLSDTGLFITLAFIDKKYTENVIYN